MSMNGWSLTELTCPKLSELAPRAAVSDSSRDSRQYAHKFVCQLAIYDDLPCLVKQQMWQPFVLPHLTMQFALYVMACMP